MEETEFLPAISARLKKSSQTGYTGLSVLHRLHYLYKFDPITDIVRDVMHLIPMNCVKKSMTRLLEEDIIDTGSLQAGLNDFTFSKGL